MRKSKCPRPYLNLIYKLLPFLTMTALFHPLIVKTIAWPLEASTAAFAQALAARPGLADALIELRGDLGAGKTTFVRHLLGALGVQGRIKSPTYAVVEPYRIDAIGLDIWHFDFYRFNDPDEWEEAGFRDVFASRGLKLVEWLEKAGPHVPQPDVVLAIDVASDESRAVTLSAFTPTGSALIA